MVRSKAKGYSKGTSEERFCTSVVTAAIHITNQGRAVIVARIREFGD
jgi:hypothetical protein